MVAALLFWVLPGQAGAHAIPESCAALAAREKVELPRTEAEARAALVRVRRKAIRGDTLAIACWAAVIKLRVKKEIVP